MATAKGSKRSQQKAPCPPIPRGFEHKLVTPTWHPGMSVEDASAAWFAYLRFLGRHVRKMPRVTRATSSSRSWE